MYYSKRLGPKLKQLLAEAEAEGDARLALEQECDVARVMALRAIEMYDKVVIEDGLKGKNLDEDHVSRLKAQATITLREALNHVASLVLASHKAKALSASTLDAKNVDWVISEVGLVIARHLREDSPALFDKIMTDLNNIKVIGKEGKANVTISVD
jgi:hypothetical protein